ncbi:MAG: hypothetical protein AAF711_00255 [Planctomycetota bacterium]
MLTTKALTQPTIVAGTTLILSGAAQASIVFTLEPGSPDFPAVTSAGGTGQAALSSETKDGVTLTVTAAGGNGVIAASVNGDDGFGVAGNASFDLNGNESFSLTFDQDVFIDQLSFDVFSFGESVDISIPSLAISTNVTGNQTFTPAIAGIAAAGNANGDFTLNFNDQGFELSAGEAIIVTTTSSILVDSVSVTLVPEPGSLALASCALALFARRRHG